MQLLSRNEQRSRGGFVFKAHRLLYHSTLGVRVILKKRRSLDPGPETGPGFASALPGGVDPSADRLVIDVWVNPLHVSVK